MHCPYINGLDSMDWRFSLFVTSPWKSALFVVITVNRPLSYLGTFSGRLYILSCRYRYTIHEYWSSMHWCHIHEEKHCTRQCLEQQTYWLMKKLLMGIYWGPHMFLRRHLAGKPVVASPKVGCFLRLPENVSNNRRVTQGMMWCTARI